MKMSGQNDLKAALGAKKSSESKSAKVTVYGYSSSKSPFFKEARAVKPSSDGCLLILDAAVNPGEKLLLISAAAQHPAEAEIVNSRSLTARLFEVEVSFPSPRHDFWPVSATR
jgi:hypothetical protein